VSVTCPNCGYALTHAPTSDVLGLTRRQKAVLDLFAQAAARGAIPPSFTELAKLGSLKSKGTIHRHVHALIERGYLRMLPNCARSVSMTAAAWSLYRDAA
jgi:SOS-response transcriptional repressor LexA